MAARRPKTIRAVPTLTIVPTGSDDTDRALSRVAIAVQELQSAASRVVVTQDLDIGKNVVRHSLGRRARGYTLVPTVVDATFAHAVDDTNSNPDREVWITVAGAAQPGARVEIW